MGILLYIVLSSCHSGVSVTKSGDTRIGLVGFPSVGKSTLLTSLTGTRSEAAAYEFTTLTCIPGTMKYRGARIQVLDLRKWNQNDKFLFYHRILFIILFIAYFCSTA